MIGKLGYQIIFNEFSSYRVSYSFVLLTCTCISFHPGRVEPASSRASIAYRYLLLLIEEESLGFD